MSSQHENHKKVREPVVDGLFYPSEERELLRLLDTLFSDCNAESGNAIGIISPHAGYEYSGSIAASAFRSAGKRTPKTVVIFGPVHREVRNEIYLTESCSFRTPLGEVEVNNHKNDILAGTANNIKKDDIPHLEEHCIEVQLPFIQYLFPDAQILPILIGKPTIKNTQVLSKALLGLFGPMPEDILFVISSNMSSCNAKESNAAGVEQLLSLIRSKEWKKIATPNSNNRIRCCGAAGIATLLALLENNVHINITKTGDSSQYNNDAHAVVYYAGISFSI